MILPFEEVYVLTLCEDDTRLKHFFKEIERIGIENKIKVWYACKHPYTKDIALYLQSQGKFFWVPRGNGSAINCTREHYNIIKQALYRGVKNILVFEDDFTFNGTKEEIENFFNEPLPNDWNCIRYGWTPDWSYSVIPNVNEFKYDKTDKDFWGTQCYALDKSGMEAYIYYQHNMYSVADKPLSDLYKLNNINSYSVYKNLNNHLEEKKLGTTIQK